MIREFILTLCVLTFACVPAPVNKTSSTNSRTDTELEAAIEQARDSLADFIAKIRMPNA